MYLLRMGQRDAARTRAKDLLGAASPLPWSWSEYKTTLLAGDSEHEWDTDRAVIDIDGYEFEMNWRNEEADADLIVYAVNRLPDYEAAVDALESLLDLNLGADNASTRVREARTTLRRLRPLPSADDVRGILK